MPDAFPDPETALAHVHAMKKALENQMPMPPPSPRVNSAIMEAAAAAGVTAEIRRDLSVSGRMRWYAVIKTARGEASCRVVPIEGQEYDRVWIDAFEAVGLAVD